MTAKTACVIGGGAGGRLSLDALTASPCYEVVGAADMNAEARELLAADYEGLELYDDAAAMIEKTRPDVVCVSTWAPSHALLTKLAVEGGVKGLLVEKPLGPGAVVDLPQATESTVSSMN